MNTQPTMAMTRGCASRCRRRESAALLGFLAIVALHVVAGPAAAQVVTTTIALTGTPSPAGPNYASFRVTTQNASGQVAISAYIGNDTGPSIFVGSPGSLQTVALYHGPTPAGGVYDQINYGPLLNTTGQVAFVSYFNDATPPTRSGIFAGVPGSVQAVAASRNPAPSGGTYNGFNGGGYTALNGAGQLAFYAQLTGGSSTAGIFAGAAGSVQTVALQGTAAPAGGNFNIVSANPLLNDAGQVEFFATLTGGSSTQGLFLGTPGTLQAVALTGNVAPAGGHYSSFPSSPGSQTLNSTGQVAFLANLTGGSSTQGLFVGTPGSSQVVALAGGAAPAGGNYSSFTRFPLNSSGQLAIDANLTGGSASRGIFVGSPGSLRTTALQGLLAPGGNGAMYSGIFSIGNVNSYGQVSFYARLTGPGVTTANGEALYVGSPGAVVEIVRDGDQIDEGNGSGLHTVSAINSFGSMNDSGVCIYSVLFTDSTEGVFTATIPVPEPSSALLTIAGLLAAVRFRKRLTK